MSIKLFLTRIAACALCLGGGGAPAASAGTIAAPSPVSVDGGLIAGARNGDVASFKGIPYAAAPVGPLRWREPQPVTPWQGVRETIAYSPACAQMQGKEKGLRQSEDCLYLNVFAPAARRGKPRPVIVWFHGAGFNSNTASTDRFDGTKLVEDGAVVVTVNYRLGILASLALPELTAESPHGSSGALQHLDQLAALKWVQRNIARFGGDPRLVLAFGQSSASVNMSILQASPLSKGLFSRVMGVSGSGLIGGGAWSALPLAKAEEQGLAWQKEKGAGSLADLRALSTDQVMANAPFAMPVGVDGYVLPSSVGDIFARGGQNDVPAWVLYTRDEGFSTIAKAKSVAEYQAVIDRIFGAKAADVRALYPVASDADVRDAAMRLANDAEFGKQMSLWAIEQARTGSKPAYLGIFAYGAAAPHGADVPYWFGTLDRPGKDGRVATATADDWALSATMRKMLVAFAATGNPSIPGIAFPPFGKAERLMRIEPGFHVVAVSQAVRYFLHHRDLKVGIGEAGMAGPPGAAR